MGFRPFEGDLDSILTLFQSEAGSDSCLVRTSIFSIKFSLHFSTLFQQIVIIWAGSTSFIIIPRSEIRYSCSSTVIYFNFYSKHTVSIIFILNICIITLKVVYRKTGIYLKIVPVFIFIFNRNYYGEKYMFHVSSFVLHNDKDWSLFKKTELCI